VDKATRKVLFSYELESHAIPKNHKGFLTRRALRARLLS
jgi:hypothetical protein